MSTRSRPDTSRLIDFAKGKLSPEESLAVLDEIEKDPELSGNLEIVLGLLRMSREEWDEILVSRSKR